MSSKGVALVTGSSRGLGRGIALRLAQDGFDVAVNDVASCQQPLESLVGEIRGLGRRSVFVLADVSSEGEVKNMIALVVQDLGSLDVMVANAGVCIGRSLIDTAVDDWDRLFSVNARGTFLCYKYAAVQMIAQGRGGRIIGCSSVVGKEGQENLSAYSGTKFAIRGLTQSAARELGRYRITVNCYCPGAVNTQMTHSFALESTVSPRVLKKREEEATAIGRLGTPEDIANVVSFLAAKESSWITGQSISPNGGRHVD